MPAYGESRTWVRDLVEMLRAELTSYPGRFTLVARIVFTCTSVMFLAEVFRIPGAALTGEELMEEVKEKASGALHGLANAIEGEAPEQLSSWDPHAGEFRAKISIEEDRARDRRDMQRHTEMRLSASLLDVVSDLERRARLNFELENGAVKTDGAWTIGRFPGAGEAKSGVE